MFRQAESIMYDFCVETGVPDLCECSIHQGAAAMIGVEDLESVVAKVAWLCIVRGRARVSMEVDFIDCPHESFGSHCHWVWPLQVVLDPLACFDVSVFFVWHLDCCAVKWVILYPPIVLHEGVLFGATDVPKMSSKSFATRRFGAADWFHVDDLDDCCFLFLYFFLGCGYGAGEDFQLPLRCLERMVYVRPVCIVVFVEVIGMFWAESSMGDVQDVEAEGPQAEGPSTRGVEEEVGGLRVFINECEVAGAEVVDGSSSVFFVIVAVAALAPCIVIGSSRTRCARSRTASLRATSASMDNGGFEEGEGWGFCVMSIGGTHHRRGRRYWLLLRF
jgi:hypothetical protein